MAATKPTVTVYDSSLDESAKFATATLPEVFSAPLRPDLVNFVHTQINKNKRQAYSTTRGAGMQHSAESWGTGRAVSRIPRIQGSGTHAAGSGAFGNMCRGGRMFAPTKVWRKWHRRTNQKMKQFAVASAVAASGLVPLVMARGHQIDQTPECPLVLGGEIESTLKTKNAIEILKRFGAFADVERCANSKKIRIGKGKMRNRRYVQSRGPLLVFKKDDGCVKAFRNIPGVDVCRVESLNLLQLAPGGHLGRFVVWTQAAFEALDEVYASKKGFSIPVAPMKTPDVARIVNSDEVQSVIRAARDPEELFAFTKKRNPLKKFDEMVKLNPFAAKFKEAEKAAHGSKKRKKSGSSRSAKRAFYEKMVDEGSEGEEEE